MQRSIVVLVLLAATPALADTYYVASDGDDDASGAAAAPWLTIQRAVTDAGAGDVVIVAAGDYAGFTLEGVHGTAQQPVVYRGQAGARVTSPGPVPDSPLLNTALRSYDWPRWPHGIVVEDGSHIVIEGFEVTGMPAEEFSGGDRIHRGGAGILLSDSHHVTVRDNRAHDNGRWGIFAAFCDDLVVAGNEASGSILEHGIYLSNSGDRNLVRGNHLFGNHQAGLHLNSDNNFHSDGYASWATVDGVSSELVVEQNIIHDNGEGGAAAINCDGVQDSTIRNNLLYANHATGIALYQIDGYDGARRNVIVNNTIVNAADSRWAIRMVGCTDVQGDRCASASAPFLAEWERPPALVGAATGTVLYNNIVYNHSSANGALYIDGASLALDPLAGVGLASDSNLMGASFWADGVDLDLAGWRAATGQDAASAAADLEALCSDPSAGDYTLVAGCAAIDNAASAHAPAVDLLGRSRPVGDGFDIGAYEWCAPDACDPVDVDAGSSPDAAGAGSDTSSGGCGCRGTNSAAPAWLSALLLSALLFRRRSRGCR